MLITPKLKEHLAWKFGLPADAPGDDVALLVGEKMASGHLTLAEYRMLTSTVDSASNHPGAQSLQALLEETIDKRLDVKLAPMNDALAHLTKAFGIVPPATR